MIIDRSTKQRDAYWGRSESMVLGKQNCGIRVIMSMEKLLLCRLKRTGSQHIWTIWELPLESMVVYCIDCIFQSSTMNIMRKGLVR